MTNKTFILKHKLLIKDRHYTLDKRTKTINNTNSKKGYKRETLIQIMVAKFKKTYTLKIFKSLKILTTRIERSTR